MRESRRESGFCQNVKSCKYVVCCTDAIYYKYNSPFSLFFFFKRKLRIYHLEIALCIHILLRVFRPQNFYLILFIKMINVKTYLYYFKNTKL